MFEIEAKFQAKSPLVLDQIRSQKQVAGYILSDRANTPQQDTYLDTATRTLLRHGASLRLRRKALASRNIEKEIQLVTFKSQTKEVYTRTELEMPITDQQARALLSGNLEKIHVAAIEEAVNHLKGENIYPVLHIENIRETWRINTDAGCVEVCLDDVRYADVDKTQFIQEYGVELELKAGESVFLQQLADALSQQYNLIPLSQSKYERGVVLLDRLAAKVKT